MVLPLHHSPRAGERRDLSRLPRAAERKSLDRRCSARRNNGDYGGALLIGGTTDDGVNKLRVSGGVTVDTGNSYKVNDVAVVGVRKTGWAAATGTATRTTFATTTVTTAQLAERLKALIDDLISHGLVGA